MFVDGLVHELGIGLVDGRGEELEELLGALEKSIFETDVIEKLVPVGYEDDRLVKALLKSKNTL